MPVIDRDGALIGAVKYVREGNPRTSVVVDGKPFAEESLNEAVARALTCVEPQVNLPLAEQLVRRGFLKVAGVGLLDQDRYVAADQIACSGEDVVRLAVCAEELAVERQDWI